MSPFPAHLWLIAIRDTLRWILEYQAPAATGEVKVTVQPKEPTDG